MKVILWSASWDVPTGQAIVTKRVFDRQVDIIWMPAIYQTKLKGILSIISALLILLRGVTSKDCSVIYLVCSRTPLGFLRDIPALVPALFGIRVVVHVHGSDLNNLLSRRGIIGFLSRNLYRKCELILPSVHLIDLLKPFAFTGTHVIENFTLQGEGSVANYSSGSFRILWNSNVMASKGIRELVDGARLARAGGVDLCLTILGRPISDNEADATEMSQFLDGLMEEDWIIQMGPVSAIAASQAVLECDMVALPSEYPSECQPLSLIQAMCAGRKILVTDTPALRATLMEYPAHFTMRDPSKIASAILEANASAEVSDLYKERARIRFAAEQFDAEIARVLWGVGKDSECRNKPLKAGN